MLAVVLISFHTRCLHDVNANPGHINYPHIGMNLIRLRLLDSMNPILQSELLVRNIWFSPQYFDISYGKYKKPNCMNRKKILSIIKYHVWDYIQAVEISQHCNIYCYIHIQVRIYSPYSGNTWSQVHILSMNSYKLKTSSTKATLDFCEFLNQQY